MSKLAKLLGFVGVALLLPQGVTADPTRNRLKDFCEITKGAPISERCIGFVAAIVERTRYRRDGDPDICIPISVATEQIILKTRPWLRKRGEECEGKCPPSSFIEEALMATYPCKKNK